MPDSRTDFVLGLVCTALYALILCILIPLGVEQPISHDAGQISPAAYPRWIACAGLVLSLLLSLQALWRWRSHNTAAPNTAPAKAFPLRLVCKNTLAFAMLLLFYCTINICGMIIGSFVLYATFALLAGERNIPRLVGVNMVLCLIMYVFFVNIAAVPIPMGLLQYLL